MNIYLDIDGVLLANESNVAIGAVEFLGAVLAEYPDSTHWLTTHYKLLLATSLVFSPPPGAPGGEVVKATIKTSTL